MQNTLKVAGYACYFNHVDANNDIILASAFNNHALSNKPLEPCDVKFLYQHDVTRPIGTWNFIQPDTVGLYVEGIVNCDLIDGFNASVMTQHRIINGLSIGYKPVHSYRDASGHRVLEAITLFEISLVTFPMQKNAYLYHITD